MYDGEITRDQDPERTVVGGRVGKGRWGLSLVQWADYSASRHRHGDNYGNQVKKTGAEAGLGRGRVEGVEVGWGRAGGGGGGTLVQ